MMNRGSEWRRWEPHIHAPGTIMNDQFNGPNAWNDYLSALEKSKPTIEAIAVTDYYVTDTYKEVVRYSAAGRLPAVKLIFPNIELRLDVATAKGGFVNLHLFVSPEDPNHLEEIRRLLSRLQFNVMQDSYNCTREDLIRLGRKADPSILDDRSALAYGANQFKVNFQTLREVLSGSGWAQKNILIAVAGGTTDGTAGVREAADQTTRREIEGFAHIIFASSVAQREFWLGQRALSPNDIRTHYRGLKPCLHGSDAHKIEDIASPFGDRFSWIKGGLEFDALRQACIDPEGRSYVGDQPPRSATPSQVISHVTLKDAPWMVTPVVPLNAGLVAIIGARGSGKTALVDVIAAACDSIPISAWDADQISPSFLSRARELVGNAAATLTWGAGATVTRSLDGRDANDHMSFPRARYLSQQFVEELCSASGVSDGLVNEIERVIFESHSQDDREWAIDFDGLRDQQTARFQQAREREDEAISNISERIATELEKESLVIPLTAQVAQKAKLVADYISDRAKLVIKGTEAQVARHTQLGEVAQKLRNKIKSFGNQRRTFVALQDEVRSTRTTGAPEMLRQVQARHTTSGLNQHQWDEFLLIHKGDVDKSLTDYIAWADREVTKLNGVPPLQGDPNVPLIADSADLGSLPLALIAAEISRLETVISADRLIREQYAALSKRIAQENGTLQSLQTRLTDAQEAAARRKQLQIERDDTYGRVFEALISEQIALADLYAPLMTRIASSSGTLKKLGFSVSRIADVERWGSLAEEELLDRRKAGPFQGRGTLIGAATEALKPAWETGSAADVQTAMTAFIGKYLKDLLSHAPHAPTQQAEFRSWLKQFAHWLFSTNHITVRYEISYDGVDIQKLSPGTRGIVLLLLYLALDDSDDRPLVIDQPEENLDPKSVFDELVALFVAAKAKRQVIMVTHNANLVVNTDADQIIVASAGPHPSGGLPPITYMAGGLESAEIRKAVCDILEGGEAAFRERARRLRVGLER